MSSIVCVKQPQQQVQLSNYTRVNQEFGRIGPRATGGRENRSNMEEALKSRGIPYKKVSTLFSEEQMKEIEKKFEEDYERLRDIFYE